MNQDRKAIIIAPFWRRAGHVGNYRVDRFVRWLSSAGYFVVVVRAGSRSENLETPWGLEVTIRDRLGFYKDESTGDGPAQPRKPNPLRRWLALRLFNPDPGVVWGRAVAKDRQLLSVAADAALVLSSSPPESSHVAAAGLARALKTRLIVDTRDGWLDDPLKPLLRDSRIQRWREGRLERRVLRQADKIFVSSSGWQALLSDRLPWTRSKLVVLTNCFPPDESFAIDAIRSRPEDKPLELVHAGRFTGSRLSQKVRLLLEPLSLGLAGSETGGNVTLLGDLEPEDLEEVEQCRSVFDAKGWTIEVKGAVSREKMMLILGRADGHLLLSASVAALPSKLFEYLPLGIPIFVSTPRSSALWQVGESLEQLFVTDYRAPDEQAAARFIAACEDTDKEYAIPTQFSETALCETFLREVRA